MITSLTRYFCVFTSDVINTKLSLPTAFSHVLIGEQWKEED